MLAFVCQRNVLHRLHFCLFTFTAICVNVHFPVIIQFHIAGAQNDETDVGEAWFTLRTQMKRSRSNRRVLSSCRKIHVYYDAFNTQMCGFISVKIIIIIGHMLLRMIVLVVGGGVLKSSASRNWIEAYILYAWRFIRASRSVLQAFHFILLFRFNIYAKTCSLSVSSTWTCAMCSVFDCCRCCCCNSFLLLLFFFFHFAVGNSVVIFHYIRCCLYSHTVAVILMHARLQ